MPNLEINLEKKVDAKLDSTERKNLEKLTAEDFKKQLQTLKDEKFDLSAKNKGVRLEDIVKNYNTATGKVDMNGEKIIVGKGTDLAAWIQVLMIADGRKILTNEAEKRGTTRGVDGYIGAATAGAIDDYKGDMINVGKTNTLKTKSNVELPETLRPDDVNAIKNGLNRFVFEANLGAQVINFMKGAKILNNTNQLNTSMYSITTQSPYMVKFTVNNDKIKNKEYKIPLTSLLGPRAKNDSAWNLTNDAENTVFSKFKDVLNDNNSLIAAEKLQNDKETLSDFQNDWKELQADYKTDISSKSLSATGKINVCNRYINSYKLLKDTITKSSTSLKSPLTMKPLFSKLATAIDTQIKTTLKNEQTKAMSEEVKNSLAALQKTNGKVTDMSYTSTLSSYLSQLGTIETTANGYKDKGANVADSIKNITEQKEFVIKMKRYLGIKEKLDKKTKDLTERYNKKRSETSESESDTLKGEIKEFQSQLEKGIYYPTFKKYARQMFAAVAKDAEYQKYIDSMRAMTKKFN